MDAGNPPAAGAIVVIGSSSIVYWHERIHDDLAPLTIIARGFGGAMVNDVLYYAHRVIIPYRPRAVVIYAGDNDIAAGVFVPTVEARFRELVQLLRADLPEARLYLISQKPSPSRAKHWPAVSRLNDILRAMCDEMPGLTYIDITPGMLDEEGRAIPGQFMDDMLHMNRQGYEAWIEAIRPLLLEHELAFEAVPAQP
jgi:lysophospholipase L1-like esterase